MIYEVLQMVTEGIRDKEEGHISRREQGTICLCSVPEIRRRSGNPSHSHLQSSYLGNKIRTWRAWQCCDTWSIVEDCRWEQTEHGIRGQSDTPGCSHLKLSYSWRRAWSYDIFKNPEDGRRQYVCKASLLHLQSSLLIFCMLWSGPRPYLMSLWSCSYWDLRSLWSPWIRRLTDSKTHRKKNAMFV